MSRGRVLAAALAACCAATGAAKVAVASPPDRTPVAADLVANGDFETGNLSQWSWGAQCANTGVPSGGGVTRGTVGISRRVVGQGKYAAQFYLPASPDERSACEVLDERNIGLGTDDYYGLMVYFPKNWREPSPAGKGWGVSIAQLGFQGIWGSPVSLQAHAHDIVLATQSGLCTGLDTLSPRCAYESGRGGNLKPMLAVPRPLPLHRWIELIVRVHWATDSTGVVQSWYRLKGQRAWKRSASLTGYPTVQWTQDRLSTLRFNSTADKIGAYRAAADFPITFWLDGYVRARSFAAAAAALP